MQIASSNMFHVTILSLTIPLIQGACFLQQPEIEHAPARLLQCVNMVANEFNVSHQVAIDLTKVTFTSSRLATVPESMFEGFKSLKHIDLSASHIFQVEDRAFNNTRALATLLLNNNNLTDIHNHTFIGVRHLKTLNLSYNNIEIIRNGTFNELKQLYSLNLRRNNIRIIDAYVFSSLHKLEILDLQENLITELTLNTLVGLVSLKNLHLSDNQIKILDPLVFKTLIRIEFLELQRNQIELVHENQFKNLTNLNILSLNENFIHRIPASVFNSATNLEYLDLSYNDLSEINENLLQNLSKLIDLKLGHNHISTIKNDTFSKCGNLKFLALNNNRISKIEPRAFENSNLLSLELGSNSLTNIERETFIHLPNLTYLNLSSNHLNEVGRYPIILEFLQLKKLKELNLNDNNFTTLNLSVLFGHLTVLKKIEMAHNPRSCVWLRNMTEEHWKKMKFEAEDIFNENKVRGVNCFSKKMEELREVAVTTTEDIPTSTEQSEHVHDGISDVTSGTFLENSRLTDDTQKQDAPKSENTIQIQPADIHAVESYGHKKYYNKSSRTTWIVLCIGFVSVAILIVTGVIYAVTIYKQQRDNQLYWTEYCKIARATPMGLNEPYQQPLMHRRGSPRMCTVTHGVPPPLPGYRKGDQDKYPPNYKAKPSGQGMDHTYEEVLTNDSLRQEMALVHNGQNRSN